MDPISVFFKGHYSIKDLDDNVDHKSKYDDFDSDFEDEYSDEFELKC